MPAFSFFFYPSNFTLCPPRALHSLTRVLTFISSIHPTHQSYTMVSGRVRRSEDTYAAFIVYRRTQTAIDSVLAARDSAGPKETTRVFGYQIIAWNAWCKKLGFAYNSSNHRSLLALTIHAETRLLLIMLLTSFMTTS